MTRFHLHLSVASLADSIAFYSGLFGQSPDKQRADYARWTLDEPGLNFAISARGHNPGVNHLGFQAESADELAALRKRAQDASDDGVQDRGETSCCYASSEKHWVLDPQGVAWEHFHTLSDAGEFHGDSDACCIPIRDPKAGAADNGSACCLPNNSDTGEGTCCD